MFGADIRIHVTFLLVLVFVWFTEAPPQGPAGAGRGLALVAIIFGSVLVHELVQAAAGRRMGVPARAIILLPIGGVTLLDEGQQMAAESGAGAVPLWKRDLRVAAAGLLASLLIAGISAVVVLSMYPWVGLWKLPLVHSGHLLRSLVWCNLFLGAQLEERSLVFHSVLEQVRLEEVMLTDFATLSPGDTLQDALHKAVHCLQDDFPVIRGSDMVGVISKQKILQALRASGNSYVQSAMNQVYEVGQKGESLSGAFHKITQGGLTLIPVVEDQRLVGIVTLQNLMHSMAMLAESRRLREN